MKRYENDKYIVVMRRSSLNELKEKKFDILEDVKTINIGNEMAVTISMGIGADAGSFAKNSEYAKIAIDLALGRGGDQVVLKDGSKIQYFGGKTQAVEKNTRVKARVKAHALKEFMNTKEKVVGSVNVQLAEKTGFTQEDAELLKECLKTLFENDASSARPEGSLEVCKMYWWQHKDKTPLVSTGCIQRSFHIDKVERPKAFKEYNIKWEQQPNCVEPEIFDFV